MTTYYCRRNPKSVWSHCPSGVLKVYVGSRHGRHHCCLRSDNNMTGTIKTHVFRITTLSTLSVPESLVWSTGRVLDCCTNDYFSVYFGLTFVRLFMDKEVVRLYLRVVLPRSCWSLCTGIVCLFYLKVTVWVFSTSTEFSDCFLSLSIKFLRVT